MNSRLAGILLGMAAMAAFCALVPHASAQVSYTDADNPTGPMQMVGWAAGIGTLGVMAGIGVWTAVRRR
ncbi:MAG TPA: hypothetical protein VJ792_06055 [Candidatus Nitrosotalea sp.]|nr:hypothetical protein [Candidatus Nitrosotalea sp.]